MVQTERHTMRTVVCATLAHALLLVAAPGLAQDQTSPPASPAQTATATPTTTQTVPTLLGSKITGLKLLDKNGENIGSIRSPATVCSNTSSGSGAPLRVSARQIT